MNGFRVIKEQTHKHKRDTLYVLLFRDGDSFGIDVTNSVTGFGRIVIETKEQALYLFDRFNSLIVNTNNYLESCEKCASILNSSDFIEAVLYLHTDKGYIGKDEIYALTFMLGLKKEEKFTSMHSIILRKKSEENPIAEFLSKLDSDKYTLCFF